MNAKRIAQLVDTLGQLNAEMAELKDDADRIKKQLIEAGVTPVEGDHYRATVVTSNRTYIDWKTIAERFNPSRQLIAGNTTKKPVTSVRVVARKGGAA